MRSFCSTEIAFVGAFAVREAMARSRSHSVSGTAVSIAASSALSPCARRKESGSAAAAPGRRAIRVERPALSCEA